MSQPSPEEDAAIAERALEAGDLPHAAHHIGCALAGEPDRASFIALADRVIAAAPEPLALIAVPGSGQLYIGDAAMRARVLAATGKTDDALRMLLQLAAVQPEQPFLAWAEPWLEAALPVGAEDYLQAFSALLRAHPGTTLGGPARERLATAMPVALHAFKAHPAEQSLVILVAALLRKVGELDAALAIAGDAHELGPSWQSAVALAMVEKARGELDASARWYEEALRHQPDDLSVRLDLGDLYCSAGRLDEGLRWYDDVVAREPEHAWAFPSQAYYRAVGGDARAAEALEAFARAHPDNGRAQALAARRTAWVGWLPSPADAIVEVWLKLVERLGDWKDGSELRIRVSSVEAPSAVRAGKLALERLGATERVRVTLEVDAVPEPDPRQPAAPVGHLLWTYEGTVASPAVEAPPPDVTAPLEALAAQPYDVAVWSRAASLVAEALGPARTDEVVAQMAHPTPGPDEIAPWDWVQRLQLAAALTLAHLPHGERALTDVLLGPMDWAVDAAAIALAQRAVERPERAADLEALFDKRLSTAPRSGYCSYRLPLLSAWLRLPGLSDEDRARLAALRAALEEA